ncbi:MAG: hypothetical protein RL757_2281 [Bacteroidota bacterium]|jgi:hypothetical protein
MIPPSIFPIFLDFLKQKRLKKYQRPTRRTGFMKNKNI